MAACCLALAPGASAAKPAISTATLQPGFDWDSRDYVLRSCDADPAPKLQIEGAKGWLAAVDDGKLKPGSFSKAIAKSAGESTTVSFKQRGHESVRVYHLRCLPDDFPDYTYKRKREGGPRMFSLQMGEHYGVIIGPDGAPVWWYKANGEPDNIAVMPDGTVSWAPVSVALSQTGDYEVHNIRGRKLHHFAGAGNSVADVHDLRLLPNGDYLMGAQVTYTADTSAYGGSANSQVIGIQIQEFSPDGDLVWKWDSRGHIGLEETPARWWASPLLQYEPYDIVHWNAVEDDGNSMLISMRHTDAIYKIDKRTGDVVWKMGGTPTPESLQVLGDEHADYPFGGQHDVRLQPDGTITVHDNRTLLNDGPPRLVRYRVDEDAGTARLVEQVTDPNLTASLCCGSARRLDDGSWLAGWGANPITVAYDPRGRRIFSFKLEGAFSYRSNPVPKGAVKRKQLRKAMDAIAAG